METFPNDASDARILWQRAQPTAGHGLLCIDLATPTLGSTASLHRNAIQLRQWFLAAMDAK